MDLENLKCPQYVCFDSDSFLESLNDFNSPGSVKAPEKSEAIEGNMSESESTVSTEEFTVFTRSTRSGKSKLRGKATIPKPFNFQTDKRLKNENTEPNTDSGKDFISQLRNHDIPKSTVSGVTKVMPFNITESKKRKRVDAYVPLAEQIQGFHKKTPERYHTAVNKEFQPQQHWSPPKLRPRTPKLQAVKRCRAIEVLSREQQELKELEEINAYAFHARPVDPRVYKPPTVEKIETKKTTKPEAIALKTEERCEARKSKKEPEKAYEFHARPVPKAILAGPVGLGVKPEIIKTKPKSPSFTIEGRLQKRKLLEQEPKESPAKKQKIVKRQPQPPPVEPFKPKRTKIQPFSFDKSDKERFSQKEKKIQEEIEKENKPYVFKAQLLPSPAPSVLPEVSKKPTTRPEPFNFHLDNRSLKQSFAVEEKKASFKAHPATVLNKDPFIPEKPPKPLIEIKEFDLYTNRRASERLKQKELNELKELEAEKIRLEQKAAEEEKERLEVLKMRQEMVHKANPVRQFKQVVIKPSSKPLTQPTSPVFETDKRLQSKLDHL